jgi:transcriptional regulator with XRE-family HTH domain
MLVAPSDPYLRRVMGGRLKVRRHQLGLTQAQVAEQLGVKQNWVSRVEAGQLTVQPNELRSLCILYQLDPCVPLML